MFFRNRHRVRILHESSIPFSRNSASAGVALHQMRSLLGAQHRLRLHELHVAIGDHVKAITPRIADVVAANDSATLARSRDHRGHVVDDEPEVPMLNPRLHLVLGQNNELVAEIDKGATPRPAA